MSNATIVTLLSGVALLTIGAGAVLLKRAFARSKLLPEELALAVAWVFLVGGIVWLGVFLTGSTLLGFGPPWTWLAAAHFTFAGCGALTVTALACRVVSQRWALRLLRLLLFVHPIAYLVTAAGISGVRYCDELGAGMYAFLFVAQTGAVLFGHPDRIAPGPRCFLLVALIVPVATMVPAIAWAWGRPFLDITGMVRYHGLINAIGHVGFGLAAFAWSRPASHASMREREVQPLSN